MIPNPTLPFVPHFPRIQLRPGSLLFVLIFCAMIVPSANAALTCAARSHSKPDLSTFRQSVALTIPGTSLLEQSRQLKYSPDVSMFPGTSLLAKSGQLRKYKNETAFNAATALFHSNYFSPKDIVCIADNDETVTTLKQNGIWDTYGGNTVLLSPFNAPPAETRHGPRESNVFSLLAEITAEARFPKPSGCSAFMSRDSEVYNVCLDDVRVKRERHRDELMSTLPQTVLGSPNLAILETYDPEKPNSEFNAVAFTAFVGAIKTLETLSAPFYALPAPTDEMPAPQFRVFDPVNSKKLPVTSLLQFVGNELIDMGTELLFREHSDLINEFNKGDVADIKILPLSEFVDAQYRDFPYKDKDPLEQMFRAFVCQDGGNSGVTIFDIDSGSVLSAYRRIGCPSSSLYEKEVVDFTDSLLKQGELSKKLQSVSDTETQAIIRKKLTELVDIGVGQSKTLNKVHKYVAEGVLLDQADLLMTNLRALEEARNGNALKDLVNIGVAVGRIYTGYAGVGSLLGGIKKINGLYSKMPSGGFNEAMDYYHENRLEFSEAMNVSGNSVTEIVKAVSDFEGAVNSVGDLIGDRPGTLGEIEKVKKQIRGVEEKRAELMREIADRADELEKRWVTVAEELFWARQAAGLLRRNVAIILEDAIANKFLHSLQTGYLYEDWGECINSLKEANGSPIGFKPNSILKACGGIDEALSQVKTCLREKQSSEGLNLVIEGRRRVFWIGKNTQAKECYDNSLWQEQNER